MRISDWSSDVCSSDLARRRPARRGPGKAGAGPGGTVMQGSPLSSVILFHLGPVAISRPVLTTWAIMAVLVAVSWLVTRRLQLRPGRGQGVLELAVTGISGQIAEGIRRDGRRLVPLLGKPVGRGPG